ncbi:protein-coupled receptor gpr1 [Anaeramoeba ignava]|uniref:Protein-coupled receptor gpr1 n=1 Tax=Anaeramoeba ignava TaxID=1746090 RepID=A0A9Q0L6D2_ANAIG|nr:protein-coupled receptor gpr1 [Anaeramoeba ignava]
MNQSMNQLINLKINQSILKSILKINLNQSINQSILKSILKSINQIHFRSITLGPNSSYSSFEIHHGWKSPNDPKIDPPIQTEILRSGGAVTLTFVLFPTNNLISF